MVRVSRTCHARFVGSFWCRCLGRWAQRLALHIFICAAWLSSGRVAGDHMASIAPRASTHIGAELFALVLETAWPHMGGPAQPSRHTVRPRQFQRARPWNAMIVLYFFRGRHTNHFLLMLGPLVRVCSGPTNKMHAAGGRVTPSLWRVTPSGENSGPVYTYCSSN